MMRPKLTTTATVTRLRQADYPHPSDIVELTLDGGAQVTWHANIMDFALAQQVAPFTVGSTLTLQAQEQAGRLRNVRYTCEGRTFRGATYHRTHLPA